MRPSPSKAALFSLTALLAPASLLALASCRETRSHRDGRRSAQASRREPPKGRPARSNRVVSPLEALSPSPPAQKGVALGLYCEDPGWSYEPLLAEISRLGGSHVSLVVAYYLKDIHSTEITRHPRFTAPDRVVVRTIRQARKQGLEVVLFPILRVMEKPTPNHWRGNLEPRDPIKLQRSYQRLITHLAKLSSSEGVSVLSVGSELSTLDVKKEWFRPVIEAARKEFFGKLLYSGNWDHFREVAIWSLVDYIGLCGYFGIASTDRLPPLHEMISGWRDLRANLERWSRSKSRPLVFTEVGYMSQLGAAKQPWNESAKRPVSMEEQKRAYEAFMRVWNGSPRLAGVYFWNWYGWGGPKDRSYTPRRKPAAKLMSWWFGASQPIRWWVPR